MREAWLTLPADLSSAAQARRFLRDALAEWGLDRYDIAGAQVLTELATNAALHARTAYTVHLRVEPDALLIEVSDSSPIRPTLRRYGPEATTGRGIALVEAMSQAWGVESGPTGKTVWCRVAADDHGPGLTGDADPTVAPRRRTPGRAPGAGGRPGPALACAA